MRWKPREKRVKKAKKWKKRFAFFPTECKTQHGDKIKVWLEFYEYRNELVSHQGTGIFGGPSLYVWSRVHRRVIDERNPSY